MTPRRILVANIGSTSFKFRLFEMPSGVVHAQGRVERIGEPESPWRIEVGSTVSEGATSAPDYGAAVRFVEDTLKSAGAGGFENLAAFGFKPVVAKDISGTQYLNERVLKAMEDLVTIAPAHNPPYIAAIRAFATLYPGIPCIGTFETAFYDRLPEAATWFPVPKAWRDDFGIRRLGYHGASHRYATQRAAELCGTEQLKIVSCHLGGSSSIAAVVNGAAVESSWGLTAQSGLPHNNRAGDFDAFALIHLIKNCGVSLTEAERALAAESGLKGMSGLSSGDMRDLRAAIVAGNTMAANALSYFQNAIRKFIGAFLATMNGADMIVFTGGIGENDAALRSAVCADMDYCGLKLDETANAATRATEALISTSDSRIEVRVIPANEELVIARNAVALLEASPA